jgi:hypothetical protein
MATLSASWRRFRRMFSRNEWMRRLLFMPYEEDLREGQGLILIQIDGLARAQMERAMKNGRMPFLRRLINKHGYHLHSHYSGLPSSTPAVQAELFYGYCCAVPAFDFHKTSTGEYRSMFDNNAASEVERHIEESCIGSLEGGSAYCNIYSGGAESANFCASHLGINEVMRRVSMWRFVLVAVLHFYVMIRLLLRIPLEIYLSVRDLVRGVSRGHDFWEELKFIPMRTLTSIMLRDLSTLGVKMDAARGLPVIQINFIGYDEHSHRRGPGSLYAHWVLKGIDYCIGRIYKTAKLNSRRRYQVWIYSDHGQEKVTPYDQYAGRPIAEAVLAVLQQEGIDIDHLRTVQWKHATGRSTWLTSRQKPEEMPKAATAEVDASPKITNKGPVSNMYLGMELAGELRERVARALVRDAKIPLVLGKEGDQAVAWNAEGRFLLPEEGDRVLPADHPFREAVSADLVHLAHHPDAGTLILLGLNKDGPMITYAAENGSHAGPGPNETHGFILLPPETQIDPGAKGYIRPTDIYRASLVTQADFKPELAAKSGAEGK